MLRAFEPWHVLIIGGIAVMLFGAKRLPGSARSIGQSLRILRAETTAAAEPAEQPAPIAAAAPAEPARAADATAAPAPAAERAPAAADPPA